MAPKVFVDAAGIPRVIPDDSALGKLKNIGNKFADAALGFDDWGSAVKNKKVSNINQIRQYEKLLPTPYDVRGQASSAGTSVNVRGTANRRSPYVQKPRWIPSSSIPQNTATTGPKIPSGGQPVRPVTLFGSSNPIVANPSSPAPVQGPVQVQGPSPRPSSNARLNLAQGPRPAPTGLQGNRMAGILGPIKNWGGKIFQGLNLIDGLDKARRGDWNGVGGNVATGVLTRAVTTPLAPFALDMMDTQHAGGARFDKDGNSLMPELTPEQKKLAAKIKAENGDWNSLPQREPSTPTTEELNKSFLHPKLNDKSNEVGRDYDPNQPGIQGPGSLPTPGSTQGSTPTPTVDSPASSDGNPFDKETNLEDYNMYIWAKKHGKLAENVKEGSSGYSAIQKALGKTSAPSSAYGNVDLSQLNNEDSAKIYDASQRVDPQFNVSDSPVEYDFSGVGAIDPKDFLNSKIGMLSTAASSFQQPNFDGSSQPIGGKTPQDPPIVQDFQNANKNPAEVVGTDTPIGDIRIPNSKYSSGMFMDGAVPQVAGLGVETGYDPESDSWRILSTTNNKGQVTRY